MKRLVKKSYSEFSNFLEQVFNKEVKVKIQGQNVIGKIYDFNSNKDIVWVEATIDDGTYTDMWDMHLSKVTFVDYNLEDMKEKYLESKNEDRYASTKTAKDFDYSDYKNPEDMFNEINQEYDAAGLQEASNILKQYHQISEIATALEMNDTLEVGDIFTQDMINDFENGVKALDTFGFKLQKKLDELSNVNVKK
jgi:hypothetical protein